VLARRLGGKPLLAAGLALASPGILVSMGTVMTDLLMTTVWVWAVALWIRGVEERIPTANIASGFLIGLGVLTKYFAICLVPLLLVYTLLSGRKRWARAVWLMIPLVLAGGYDLYTRHLYGTGLFLQLFGVVTGYHTQHSVDIGRKILSGLAFLGAGAAPALLMAPWIWGRIGKIVLCAGGVGTALLTLALAQSSWQAGEPNTTYSWWFWLQYGLWILAGLHIIALAAAEVWSRRDRNSILLGLWLGGTIFFGIFVYHFVNIRVILPALPAVALLCVQRLRARTEAGSAALPRAVMLAPAVGLVLSLCVAYADNSLANSGRTAAEHLAPEKRDGRTWFSGHWGFQYYMEARGAKPIDANHPDFQLGDTVVTPENASNRILTRPRVATKDETFEVPVCRWLTTMRAECGAGFYADLWGPMPFVFGPVPAERYQVTVLGRR
jgi:4-amino-4-deoxy-L-arabinose transferase-like glycosyltransferase